MRYWEDFETGDEAEHGSHTITAEEIVEFAGRFDPQPFHTDPVAANTAGEVKFSEAINWSVVD